MAKITWQIYFLVACPVKYSQRLILLGLVWSWWRHQMETFSASLAICAGNSPVIDELPTQRPVTRNLEVVFDLRLNTPLSKQSRSWWLETPSRSLWRHCNSYIVTAWWTKGGMGGDVFVVGTTSIQERPPQYQLWMEKYPDSKVHGTNMGPVWGRQVPGGPHVGPWNWYLGMLKYCLSSAWVILVSHFRSIGFWRVYDNIEFLLLKLLSFFWLTYHCSMGLYFSDLIKWF